MLLYVFLTSPSGLSLVCASVSSVRQRSWCGAILVTEWDADRDLPFPYFHFLTHFRSRFLHLQLSRIQDQFN